MMNLFVPLRRTNHQQRSAGVRAFSLVETIAAAALIAGVLAPTVRAMRSGMAQSREATVRRLLANYAVRVVEERAAKTMQGWGAGADGGNFSADGHADVRYTATWSDNVALGGIAGRLMHIQATVYHDANGNATLDASEHQVAVRTKLSKLLTYESPNH